MKINQIGFLYTFEVESFKAVDGFLGWRFLLTFRILSWPPKLVLPAISSRKASLTADFICSSCD